MIIFISLLVVGGESPEGALYLSLVELLFEIFLFALLLSFGL